MMAPPGEALLANQMPQQQLLVAARLSRLCRRDGMDAFCRSRLPFTVGACENAST